MKNQDLFKFHVRYLCILTTFQKIRKLRSLLNEKNQNGALHAVFACNKFHVRLSGVTERLASNIATRILILSYKFWTACETRMPLCIFVSGYA